MRPLRLLAPALLLALTLPAAAQAERVLTLGIYLWGQDTSGPEKVQFLSIASGTTEIETDGGAGYTTSKHPTTPEELKLVEAAVEGRMKALSLAPETQPATPYVTIEWHVSQETGYAEGIAPYPLDAVPEAVQAVQKSMFGALYEGEK